jgi:hypothetical protein
MLWRRRSKTLRFESPTAVTVDNDVLWEGSSRVLRFGGMYRLHLQGEHKRTTNKLAVSATVASYSLRVPSSVIVLNLKMEAMVHPKRRFLPELRGVTS